MGLPRDRYSSSTGWDGSPVSLEADAELFELYERRLDRAIRARDEGRRLARQHRSLGVDLRRCEKELEEVHKDALAAIEAKKRSLEIDLQRKYSKAVQEVEAETQRRMKPLEAAQQEVELSAQRLEESVFAIEAKMRLPRRCFVTEFVPVIEESEAAMRSARHIREAAGGLADREPFLHAAEDFCRFTVRHRIKAASAGATLRAPLDKSLYGTVESAGSLKAVRDRKSMKKLVLDAYEELEDLHEWLRTNGIDHHQPSDFTLRSAWR